MNLKTKTMKKELFAMCIALFAVIGVQGQSTLGVKAGVNLAKLSNVEDSKTNTSFHVTAFADFPLAPQFSIQPGLSLQGKGFKGEGEISYSGENGTSGQGEGTGKINFLSLELPVNFVYYVPAGTGEFFVGAGPYIGLNLRAKAHFISNDSDFGTTISQNLKFSGRDKTVNMVDAGANFLLGYKLVNGFLINGGYNLGLTNLLAKETDKFANRVLSFGIGFQF